MNKKIRILHIVTQMNCGGLETMIMNYYRNIDRDKIQFDFLTHRSPNDKKYYDDEIRKLGGKIYHISKLNPFSYKYKKELKRFFLEHKEYNIIHVHLDCLSGIVLKIASKVGIKVRIAHCHSSSQDKNIKYLIKLYFKRLIPKYATYLFACGEESGKWMFGIKSKYTILNNSIDTNKYIYNKSKRDEIRKSLRIPENITLLGHVARFSKVKNQQFLVELMNRLKGKNIQLLFIGDGELIGEIKSIVNNYKLNDSVDFLGLRSDVPDLMQALDIFLLPSLYEGLPVSIIEAQTSGLQCIISDNVPMECAITPLVHQLNLNVDEWCDMILSLVNYDRINYINDIISSGYDIKENAIKLQKFYLSQIK